MGSRTSTVGPRETRTRSASSGSIRGRDRIRGMGGCSGRARPSRRTRTSFGSRDRSVGPIARVTFMRAHTCSRMSERGTQSRAASIRFTKTGRKRGMEDRRLTRTCPVLSSGHRSRRSRRTSSRGRSINIHTQVWSSLRLKRQSQASGVSTSCSRANWRTLWTRIQQGETLT